MNFSAVLIPPSLDAKQALRLRRFGLAALSYVLATGLVLVVWAFGALPASAALQVTAAYIAINLGLYALIRSGFNLRFEDPSLTRFQMLIAISVLMYLVYHMDIGRNIALFGCFIVFLFGIFRLNTRDFTLVTLYALAAYALVINLLMHFRPQAIDNVILEWMSWLTLAGLLPGFTIIGGHISTLRHRLRESELRFRSLTDMSSDFYWESDIEHRLMQRVASNSARAGSVFGRASPVGQRRWDIPCVSPDESGWQKHRAILDAHLPFRDFEFSRLHADGSERHLSINGDPVFDKSGAFKGYRGVGADITARKRAEQALHESAEKLRLFADNVPAMTASFDDSRRCLFANRRYAEFFGLRTADIVGMHVREIVGDDAYREIEGHFAQVLQGYPATYERTHKLANGESRYLEIKLLPHFSDQGKVLGWSAVTTDISEHKRTEQALRDSVQNLRLFADNVPAMTVSWDENLRCRFASKAFAESYGFTVENILGKHLREVAGEEAYRNVEGHFVRVLQGHAVTYQRTRKLANGESRYLEVKLLPHIGDQGEVLGCFAVIADISEYKRTEQALRDGAEYLRLLADNVPAITVSWDKNLRCRFVNKLFTEFFGVTVEDTIGKHAREVLGEEVYREVEGYLAQALQGHPVTYQRTRKLSDGGFAYIEVKLVPHIGDYGDVLGCFAVTTDITEHKLTEERVRRVAHHDSLTSLPNRLLFNDRLSQAISLAKRDSRQFAVLYLDLDKFKPVNDNLGHTAGDELLRGVAARIRQQVRESDTVARVGGDEFTVILPDIARREEAEIVAKKIISAAAAPFQLATQKQSVGIGISIGIALYPADGLDADALINAADAAMYNAKQVGSCFRFFEA